MKNHKIGLASGCNKMYAEKQQTGIRFSLLTNRHPFVDGLPEKASQESFFLTVGPNRDWEESVFPVPVPQSPVS